MKCQAKAGVLDLINAWVKSVSLENQPPKRQISLLSKAGFGPSQIADLMGTTSNTVNVRLSEMRKEASKNASAEGRNVGRTRRSQPH